ncbi:MAG TPA: response regulator transcription factor [Anaerolineales bacterium]|nr:response regulator transcription factor [Anaerolineales bacterium]
MIRIAIVDDHQVLADALKMMFDFEDNFECVGIANSLASAQTLIEVTQPDILLLDIFLLDGDGLDLIPHLRQASQETKVVVLTGKPDEAILLRAVELEVQGFITKGCSLPELLSTIEKVAQGEIVMPPELLVQVLRRFGRERLAYEKNEKLLERLTPREHEILIYLARGIPGDEIAVDLNIAPLTVRTHIRNMMSKLGVHSRLEAVTFALSQGLINYPG